MTATQPTGHDEELVPMQQLADEFAWGARMLIEYAHGGKFSAKRVDGVWYSTRSAISYRRVAVRSAVGVELRGGEECAPRAELRVSRPL